MSKRKKMLALLFLLVLIGVGGFVILNRDPVDDLPGKVIGDNPKNIPESKLPFCNFTGAGFLETPCYSPPEAIYL